MVSVNENTSYGLERAMSQARVKPLWVHYRELGSRQPDSAEQAVTWRWSELQEAIARAAEDVSMEDAERRVLVLANPAFAPQIQTTRNLIGAIQILNPGEKADEHRHTMSAIRMILDADGGYTSVDGEQFEMSHGDLILTPNWTWHAHDNTTSKRVIWFDGLDVPFVRYALDAGFLEPHAPQDFLGFASRLAERWRWVDHGLVGSDQTMPVVPHSPRIHYPWKATAAMLDRLEPSADGHVLMRYVHPQTGQAVMPTIDCFMLRLSAGRQTLRRRSTNNAICVVLDGEGASQIGDSTFSWKKNDIFTIPHWTWASHRAETDRAHIFTMTDRELYRRLELLREETATDAVDG
ncbi:gentisate 1,2-dioxygenase [Paraburkholderia sp. BL23I1N1]|uniref:cupin domain-containing protein n=1 Tax=Paraburkholderia sp. BL23I1N1 TaxID=1938802 RepID=UPI000E723BBE|nr:cupin domain-containing protein [Paraburkholderia sp. BL23I1N1]RKE38670.1 gentisate 1,2-dioxygenase [Paraburkholderia sp. BL23I1N1]